MVNFPAPGQSLAPSRGLFLPFKKIKIVRYGRRLINKNKKGVDRPGYIFQGALRRRALRHKTNVQIPTNDVGRPTISVTMAIVSEGVQAMVERDCLICS